jgi:hypothetical protein
MLPFCIDYRLDEYGILIARLGLHCFINVRWRRRRDDNPESRELDERLCEDCQTVLKPLILTRQSVEAARKGGLIGRVWQEECGHGSLGDK